MTMLGRRSRSHSVKILVVLCVLLQVVVGRSWRGFRPALSKLIANRPILVVLFEFEHAADFYKAYPSQQIIANPRNRHFKICPWTRILVLSGLSPAAFMDRFQNHISRLCPFGTVYVLPDDIQLWAFNLQGLLPFTALRDPQRRGLFYAMSLNTQNWKRYIEPEFPSTWKDDYLKKRAKIFNVYTSAATFIQSYEFIFLVGNRTMVSTFNEWRYNPATPLFINPYEYPPVGNESPLAVAIFRPQKPASIANEYTAMIPTLMLTIVSSFVLTPFVRADSLHGSTYFSSWILTVGSLVGGVPLGNLKNGLGLLMTFGLWLFLSQIFVSILKGEMVKNVAMGPTNKIHSIDQCEPNFPNRTLAMEHTYSPKTDKAQAELRMLEYDYVCFFDVMKLQPFLMRFSVKFPRADVYWIKHQEESKKILYEFFHGVRLENKYMPGHIFFRVRVCPIRGYFYFQQLLETGMFDGMRYHHFRNGIDANWRLEIAIGHLHHAGPAYDNHIRLSDEIGASVLESESADYNSWLQFAVVGLIASNLIFVGEITRLTGKNLRQATWRKVSEPLGRFWFALGNQTVRARGKMVNRCGLPDTTGVSGERWPVPV